MANHTDLEEVGSVGVEDNEQSDHKEGIHNLVLVDAFEGVDMFLDDNVGICSVRFELALKVTGAVDGKEVGQFVVSLAMFEFHLVLSFGGVNDALIEEGCIDENEDDNHNEVYETEAIVDEEEVDGNNDDGEDARENPGGEI